MKNDALAIEGMIQGWRGLDSPSGLGRTRRRGEPDVCVGTDLKEMQLKTYPDDRLLLQKQDRFQSKEWPTRINARGLDVIG